MGGVFGFDSALLILKAGGRVTRLAWGGRGNWLQLRMTRPSAHQTLHTLQRSTSDGFSSPFTPELVDILAEDWMAEHLGDMIVAKGK